MRTTRSSSRHVGVSTPLGANPSSWSRTPWEQTPPLEQAPRVWAWRPLPRPDPLGCGPGDPPSQNPQLPHWVWAWIPARHAGIPPSLETCCKACWNTTCNACWDTTIPTPHHPPLDKMTDKFKNITKLRLRALVNMILGWNMTKVTFWCNLIISMLHYL